VNDKRMDVATFAHCRCIRELVGYLSQRRLDLRAFSALAWLRVEPTKVSQRLRTRRQRSEVFQANLIVRNLAKKCIRITPSQTTDDPLGCYILKKAVTRQFLKPRYRLDETVRLAHFLNLLAAFSREAQGDLIASDSNVLL
jgi:hypothetical protein